MAFAKVATNWKSGKSKKIENNQRNQGKIREIF